MVKQRGINASVVLEWRQVKESQGSNSFCLLGHQMPDMIRSWLIKIIRFYILFDEKLPLGTTTFHEDVNDPAGSGPCEYHQTKITT